MLSAVGGSCELTVPVCIGAISANFETFYQPPSATFDPMLGVLSMAEESDAAHHFGHDDCHF